MAGRPSISRRLAIMLRWPPGVLLTSWAYTWRITPLHRTEKPGFLPRDGGPPLPAGTPTDGLQLAPAGHGALLRRRYRVDVIEGAMNAEELMARVGEDLNVVAPWGLAHFERTRGEGQPQVGDEFSVRMPGPWDGPVRVIERTPTSWRFATMDGHLEAGQIEWRAADRDNGTVRFEVESWSRPGDRFSYLLHHHLRMAKEIQLHMWISVCEKVTRLAGGRMADGVAIRTRVADV